MDRVSLIRAVLLWCFAFASPFANAFTYSITSHGFTASAGTLASAAGQIATAYNQSGRVSCTNSAGQPVGFWAMEINSYDYAAKLVAITVRRTYNGPALCGDMAIPDTIAFTVSGVNSCINGDELVDPVPCSPKPECGSNQELDEDTNTCTCASQDAGSLMVSGDTYVGCNSGCRVLLDKGWFDKTANTTWGKWRQTGDACSPGEPTSLSSSDPKVEAAKSCAAGTCPGTVNGQAVCVACTKSKEAGTTTKSESASTTASGASTPSSGTSSTGSTNTRTDCTGSACTTTTTSTTTNPDGTKTDKTESKTEPQSDYCTRNPKAEACKNKDSVWGGTCGAFTCDGDAVQCAQAKAGWELACALKVDDTSPLIAIGHQATSAGNRPSDHPANDTNTIALDLSARLSSVPLFGAVNDCISDKTVTFMGKGYTLPFSKWCPYLNILGAAFLAACYLASAFIIFRE